MQKRAHTHTYAPKHTHACAHAHKQLKQLAELLMSNNKVANIKWCMPPTTFLSCPGKINVDGQYLQNDFVTQVKLWAWEEIPTHAELHGNGSSSQDHSSWQRVWGKIANRKDYLQDIKHLRSQGTGQRLQGLRFKPGWGSNPPPPPPAPFLVSGCWTKCLVLWMRWHTKVPYSTGCSAHRKQPLLGGGLSV